MIREFVSNLFFNTALGNGFYYNLNQVGLICLGLISFIAIILYRLNEKINLRILYLFCFLLSSIATFNVLRYLPYGGDAVIYCELTTFSKNSGISIYNTSFKYTFNYPPIFENILNYLCTFNYEENYYFYLIGFGIFLAILSKKQGKNVFLFSLYFLGSFLGLRWSLKTGNFVFLELIFLTLFVVNYKKNNPISYLFLILFGFQRLWYLLLVPVFLFFDHDKSLKKFQLIFISSFFLILLNFNSLLVYLTSLLPSGEGYSIFKELPGHNTPSIYIGLVKGLYLSHSLITLFFYLLVSFIFLFLFMRNKSLSKEIVAVVLICSLILLNPYLKPYHFIFFTPLLILIRDSYLNNAKSMLLSIAYPSFFWIVASNLSVGTLTGYFQTVFFGLFVFNLVQLDLNIND